jgi:hypothetical protein
MKRKLKSVSSVAEAGPITENQLRWLIFNADANGLSAHGAIVRIGRRVYIDEDAFDRWIDAQQRRAVAA